jgi:hypothetical protein
MNSKLAENGSDDVKIEYVWLRAFFRKALDRLSSRNGQEADAHEHSADSNLTITKFDTLEIQDT